MGNRGLTLLEMLVTMGIASVLMVGILQLHGAMLLGQRQAERSLAAALDSRQLGGRLRVVTGAQGTCERLLRDSLDPAARIPRPGAAGGPGAPLRLARLRIPPGSELSADPAAPMERRRVGDRLAVRAGTGIELVLEAELDARDDDPGDSDRLERSFLALLRVTLEPPAPAAGKERVEEVRFVAAFRETIAGGPPAEYAPADLATCYGLPAPAIR